MTGRSLCAVETCDREVATSGWCSAHYWRVREHGDPRADEPIRPRRRGPRSCVIDGCRTRHYARGWCHAHYQRWHRYGDPQTEPPTRRPTSRPTLQPVVEEPDVWTCSVAGCTATPYARGWCNAHYARWRRTGDVQADRPVGNKAIRSRASSPVVPDDVTPEQIEAARIKPPGNGPRSGHE